MKRLFTTALALTLGLSAGQGAWGSPPPASRACPDRIQYKGGGYLKNGESFYYSTGTALIRGSSIYYPTGSFLKRDDLVYYPDGTYLQRADNLYYPGGSYLKRGGNYYYSNGAYLKRDTTFYHPNGVQARRNGKLYRPDGTETPFPVRLQESIGQYGAIFAEVHSDREYIDVVFRDLLVQTHGLRLVAPWDGQAFRRFEFQLNTGVPGEDVFVVVNGTQVTCSLEPSIGTHPVTFTVVGQAGSAQVSVRPGFDGSRIREGIQRLLDTGGAGR